MKRYIKTLLEAKNSGQTLVEVIIALSALLLIIAAITTAVTISVSNSTFIKNQNLANKYAQEGIEQVRHLYENREDFFDTYSDDQNFYFMGEDKDIVQGNFEVNVDNTFVRNIQFAHNVECDTNGSSPDGANELRATVSVYWSSGKCGSGSIQNRFCHKSQLVTCFTQRRSSELTL